MKGEASLGSVSGQPCARCVLPCPCVPTCVLAHTHLGMCPAFAGLHGVGRWGARGRSLLGPHFSAGMTCAPAGRPQLRGGPENKRVGRLANWGMVAVENMAVTHSPQGRGRQGGPGSVGAEGAGRCAGQELFCGFGGKGRLGWRTGLGLASLGNFYRLWAQGLSPVVRGLALER